MNNTHHLQDPNFAWKQKASLSISLRPHFQIFLDLLSSYIAFAFTNFLSMFLTKYLTKRQFGKSIPFWWELPIFSNFHLAIFVDGATSKRSHGLDDLLRSLNDKEQFLKSLNNKERFLKSAAAATNCQQQEDVVALDQSCIMSNILRLSSQK